MKLVRLNKVLKWIPQTITAYQVSAEKMMVGIIQNLVDWSLIMSNQSIKFHNVLISSFWVAVLTDKQTDTAEKHNLLGGGKAST